MPRYWEKERCVVPGGVAQIWAEAEEEAEILAAMDEVAVLSALTFARLLALFEWVEQELEGR